MRKDKDQKGSILAGFCEIRDSLDVLWKRNTGQVLDVLVPRINDLCKLLLGSVVESDGLFVDPHVHLSVVEGKTFTVLPDKSGNGGTPVAASDDADSVELLCTFHRIGLHHGVVVVAWIGLFWKGIVRKRN